MGMQYRPLGKSGLKVSAIGLGTNALGSRADKPTSINIIHAALELGINFIDTANVYSGGQSEKIIGEALRGRRGEAVVATKAGLPVGSGPYDRGASRRHLLAQVEHSLNSLATDYIDLFYVHTFDSETPLEETLSTLDDLVRFGKVRYVAASNYWPWELAVALGLSDRYGWPRFAGVQSSYSLVDRWPEIELLPLCRHQGVGLVAYYPLAGGLLTGKYRSGAVPQGSRMDKVPRFRTMIDESRQNFADRFADFARDHHLEPAALSIAWLLQQSSVSSAIVGATNPDQLFGNVQALEVAWSSSLDSGLDQMSRAYTQDNKFGWYRLN